MASAFETKVSQAVAAYNKLKAELYKLDIEVNKQCTNYEQINGALWEGNDIIKKLESTVKGAKDSKAKTDAEAELKSAVETRTKMAVKLKTIQGEIKKLEAGAGQAKNSTLVVQKTVDTLNKEAARSAMADVKATAATLKKLVADVKAAVEKADSLKAALTSLAKPAA